MCCLTFFLLYFLYFMISYQLFFVVLASAHPSAQHQCWKHWNSLVTYSLLCVCVWQTECVCVSLVAVQDWCQIQRLVWHCLVKQSMCVLRLGTCAGFLIKYAVGVNAAAEMPNRENQGGEERVGERLQNTSYHPLASIPCSLLFLSLHLSITPFHTFLSKPAPLLHLFPFNLYPTH